MAQYNKDSRTMDVAVLQLCQSQLTLIDILVYNLQKQRAISQIGKEKPQTVYNQFTASASQLISFFSIILIAISKLWNQTRIKLKPISDFNYDKFYGKTRFFLFYACLKDIETLNKCFDRERKILPESATYIGPPVVAECRAFLDRRKEWAAYLSESIKLAIFKTSIRQKLRRA